MNLYQKNIYYFLIDQIKIGIWTDSYIYKSNYIISIMRKLHKIYLLKACFYRLNFNIIRSNIFMSMYNRGKKYNLDFPHILINYI